MEGTDEVPAALLLSHCESTGRPGTKVGAEGRAGADATFSGDRVNAPRDCADCADCARIWSKGLADVDAGNDHWFEKASSSSTSSSSLISSENRGGLTALASVFRGLFFVGLSRKAAFFGLRDFDRFWDVLNALEKGAGIGGTETREERALDEVGVSGSSSKNCCNVQARLSSCNSSFSAYITGEL